MNSAQEFICKILYNANIKNNKIYFQQAWA